MSHVLVRSHLSGRDQRQKPETIAGGALKVPSRGTQDCEHNYPVSVYILETYYGPKGNR